MARSAAFAALRARYGQCDRGLGTPEIGRQLFRLNNWLVFGAVRAEIGERCLHLVDYYAANNDGSPD